MARELFASSLDKVPACENHLKGYKFSINDFSQGDFRRFSAVYKGNFTLKKKMKEVIATQKLERRRFYKKVASQRLQHSSDKLYARISDALHISAQKSSGKLEEAVEAQAVTAMKYANWKPPASEMAVACQEFPIGNSLAGLPPGSEHLSGFERLKMSLLPKRYAPAYDHEQDCYRFNQRYLMKGTIVTSVLAGFMLAIDYGLKAMGDHKKAGMSDYYDSMREAHRARQIAFDRGFLRYAYRWGWRAAFLFGTVGLISQSLCIYTLQDKSSHYVTAVGVAAAMYKWKTGPLGMLTAGLLCGCLVGIPLGFLCGTLGQNPRPIFYDAYFAPMLMSPYHYLNWTEEQKSKNQLLVASLMAELKEPKSEEEALQSDIYQDLFPSEFNKN